MTSRSGLMGLSKWSRRPSRVFGILKGSDCGGIRLTGGTGGSFDGLGSGLRGLERKSPKDLRKVV